MLDKHGKVETVSFWTDRANGVRVHSNMHDVAEKIEVGVLSFELTSQTAEGEQLVQFDHLLTPYLVSKLTVLESGKAWKVASTSAFRMGKNF